MSHLTDPMDDALCCAPRCMELAHLAAPVPLCARHVRQTYEFGISLIAGQVLETSREWAIEEAERKRLDSIEQQSRSVEPREPAVGPAVNSQTVGVVYFMRRGPLVKIGWTATLSRRMAQMQPGELLATQVGTMHDERKCHAAFAHLREHGEWFRPADDLLAFIASLDHRAA